MTAPAGQSSAGEHNKEWPPEVAARLRTAMIWFVVVMLLSMVLTIAYVAGRTWSVAEGAAPIQRVAAIPVSRPESPPAPRPTEAVLPQRDAAIAPVVEVPSGALSAGTVPPGGNSGNAGEPGAAPAATTAPPGSVPLQEDSADLSVETPVAGLYLQVAATDRATAEKMVRTIRSLGLSGLHAPGPSDQIFRVLVGPFDSEATVMEVRNTLESNGYHPFAKRYR